MDTSDTSSLIGASFCGVFDGQGHTVWISCDRWASVYGDSQSVGLIGRLGVHDSDPSNMRPSGAAVRNVVVKGSVRGNRSVGGIVGKIGKTDGGAVIENCANFASVSGTDAKGTGGIAGAAWNGGTISNCYNAGAVNNTHNSYGGIAGSNEISVVNCYNVGMVTGAGTSAAIATSNGGDSYVNCYWLETSADVGVYNKTLTEVTAKSSADMKTDGFAALLGGAFKRDTGNINNGYPVLSFQSGGAAAAPPEGAKTTTDMSSTTVVKDGEAVTTVKIPEEGMPLPENPERYVINVETDGESVERITVEIPKEVITLESGSNSEIEIRSEVAGVLLPNKTVAALAETGGNVTVKASKNESGAYTFTVSAGGGPIDKLDGGIKAVIPAEDLTPGTVAVIVHEDGTEEVIRKSYGKDGAVNVPLGGSATVKIIDNGKAFADVTAGEWYADSVAFATGHELFQGTGVGLFSPGTAMNRAMLVTVLHRLEDAPEAVGVLFADVSENAYYADAVLWAASHDIAQGTGAGFDPDADITREQLAVMLYRYAVWAGYDIAQRSGFVSERRNDGAGELSDLDGSELSIVHFDDDADDVSEWAADAVIWAVDIGLIQGRGDSLAPQGTATRAEVATILMRFVETVA
jgi:hypothetical protein